MGSIRLTPIEKPKSLFLRMVYMIARWKYGKVITPLKVIYARVPSLLMFSVKLERTEQKLSLPKESKILIKSFVSRLNDCRFCADLAAYEAAKNSVEGNKILELLHYKNSDTFSGREKALFAYLEEVTVMKSCSDKTFCNLRSHFSEKEIVEITWLCAKENYYNMMARPFNIPSDQLANSLTKEVEKSGI